MAPKRTRFGGANDHEAGTSNADNIGKAPMVDEIPADSRSNQEEITKRDGDAIESLIEPLNNMLKALRPTNLQDALLRAKPLAVEIQKAQQGRRNYLAKRARPNNWSNQPTNHAYQNQHVVATTAAIELPNVRCYDCQEYGHYRNKCPKRTRASGANAVPINATARGQPNNHEGRGRANRGQGRGAIDRTNAAIGQPIVGDEGDERAVLHAAIDNPGARQQFVIIQALGTHQDNLGNEVFVQGKNGMPKAHLGKATRLLKGLKKGQQIYTVKLNKMEQSNSNSRPDWLKKYADVFPEDLTNLTPYREVDHEIETIPGCELVSKRPYKMSLPEAIELKEQLKQLIKQGLLDPDIFRPYLDDFVLVFFDDILIYSKDKADHEDVKEYGRYVHKKDGTYILEETRYFNHIISKDGMCMDSQKLETKKNIKHVWTFKGRKAFTTLEERLTSQPILELFDLSEPFEAHCNASGDCLGVVLLQEGHPIAYESYHLHSNEQALGIYEIELLAILQALDTWKNYFLGMPFIIRTDH
ncbi:hypothetical protein L7F22_015877 [Adiantum nelumboides]|nr:hypothetical protein [Adiantum nelumboides]